MATTPIEHQLVAAVKAMDIDALNTILDVHTIDLNKLPGAALAAGRPRTGHYIHSNSGGILHAAVSLSSGAGAPAAMQPILDRLLQSGANANSSDWDGLSPLHWSCHMGTDWAISALLLAGASVNATDGAGRTPLHKLCKPTTSPALGTGAVQRLLQPLLAAGADPTVPGKDGMRPYDLLSPFAAFGASAVKAERAGLLSPDNPPVAVAGVTIIPRAGGSSLTQVPDSSLSAQQESVGTCGKCDGPHRTANCPHYRGRAYMVEHRFCRWDKADEEHIQRLARELDQQRQRYVQVVRMLLLWRQSAAAPYSRPACRAVAAIPEEVFHSSLLRACPDSGLITLWRQSFDVVAEQARVANLFSRRTATLAAWLARNDVCDASDSFLEQLSEEYDDATSTIARLRSQRGEACARALRPTEAFAEAARRVLYGEEDEEDEDGE